MEKEVRFRILNKTSKTVTVKLGGKPMEFPWEEFNKKLVVVDKFWAVLNEEEKKKQEEADNLVSDAVVCVMLQRGNADAARKLAAIAQLATITKKLQEMLECTNAEVIQIIRQRLMMMNLFMVNPMFSDETVNRELKHYHKSKKHYEKPSKTVPIGVEKKPTFGDAFSALSELKEKMEK